MSRIRPQHAQICPGFGPSAIYSAVVSCGDHLKLMAVNCNLITGCRILAHLPVVQSLYMFFGHDGCFCRMFTSVVNSKLLLATTCMYIQHINQLFSILRLIVTSDGEQVKAEINAQESVKKKQHDQIANQHTTQ